MSSGALSCGHFPVRLSNESVSPKKATGDAPRDNWPAKNLTAKEARVGGSDCRPRIAAESSGKQRRSSGINARTLSAPPGELGSGYSPRPEFTPIPRPVDASTGTFQNRPCRVDNILSRLPPPRRCNRGRAAGKTRQAVSLARPPIATDRLTKLADGPVALPFRRSSFAQAQHSLSWHPRTGGRVRSKVVPAPPPAAKETDARQPSPYRLSWTDLRRVFLVGALECPRCHDRMRVVGAVTEPGAIERVLRHVGESPEPPHIARSRTAGRGWRLRGGSATFPTQTLAKAFLLDRACSQGRVSPAWRSRRRWGPCFHPAGQQGSEHRRAAQLT